MVVLLHNMSKAFIVVKVLLREVFCWYELFMNLRADIQKMKPAKIYHKSFTTQLL